MSVTRAWNTSEATQSLYTPYIITAEASTVRNETEIDNNSLVDVTVTPAIRGDSNGNKIVNILDTIAISKAFGSMSERITIHNLILIARCLGQRWP